MSYCSLEVDLSELHSGFDPFNGILATSCWVDLCGCSEIFSRGLVVFHMVFDVAPVDVQIGVMTVEIFLCLIVGFESIF